MYPLNGYIRQRVPQPAGNRDRDIVMSAFKPAPASAGRIIIILGALAAFAPVATDMYLPAFGLMAAHFGVEEGSIEATLSAFFLGLAVGQAFYGPLIDRFGRRGPLLAGIGIYTAATLLCLVAPDVTVFTALRFLQAVGGCAGMIVGRAVVRDLFDEREGARALSLLMMVMTLAPILAPVLGGFIVTVAGWRTVFLFMLAFGLICAVLVWRVLPETLPPERRHALSLRAIAATWAHLLGHRPFIVPALVGGLAQACMFAFITGSPFVFINLHGASAQTYGFLFALIACALIVSAQLNRMALRRFRPPVLLGAALCLNVVAGLTLVAVAGRHDLVLLLIPLWFAIGSLGFITANAAAIAMGASGPHSGSGSSLIGILQFSFAFAVSALVAGLQNGTAYPMTVAIAACGSAALLLWSLARLAGGRARA